MAMEFTITLPDGPASYLTQYAAELKKTPAWVAERIILSYFCKTFAEGHVWGEFPRTLPEFCEPGYEAAELAEWLCEVYTEDASA